MSKSKGTGVVKRNIRGKSLSLNSSKRCNDNYVLKRFENEMQGSLCNRSIISENTGHVKSKIVSRKNTSVEKLEDGPTVFLSKPSINGENILIIPKNSACKLYVTPFIAENYKCALLAGTSDIPVLEIDSNTKTMKSLHGNDHLIKSDDPTILKISSPAKVVAIMDDDESLYVI